MSGVFKKDIFSNSIPIWNSTEHVHPSILSVFAKYFSKDLNEAKIEFSGAFEINSSNLKIIYKGEKYLLKRWGNNLGEKDIRNVLHLMQNLSILDLPIPVPIPNLENSLLTQMETRSWSLFPFIDGEYFTGRGNECHEAAVFTAKLTEKLFTLPNNDNFEFGPQHLSDSDEMFLAEVGKESSKWEDIFGTEISMLLHTHWDQIITEWTKLRSSKLETGPEALIHFDLHPHNLLFNRGYLAAILDFESCKILPIGYGLAFGALKQCRQAIAYSEGLIEPKRLGQNYLDVLQKNFPLVLEFRKNFSELAIAEAIRRICIILKLNFEINNRSWNHVLPIQIAHISEARALFDK